MRKILAGAMLVVCMTADAGVVLVQDAQPLSEIVIATNAPQIVRLAARVWIRVARLNWPNCPR